MRVSLKKFEVAPRLLSALVVAVALAGCATGCSEKSARIAGQKVILAPAEAAVRTAQSKTYSISIWGVATDDKIKTSEASSSYVLSIKAQGFALQMLGFLYGAEAINSQSSFSVASRRTFSSAGLSVKDKSLISHDNISATILRMEWPGPESLPAEPALASIATLTPVFDSSGVKKSFQLRFDAALNGKIRDKMNSLGLKRCLVYLNSMAYDEKAGIHAEFSLFKSNSL